MLEVSAGQTCGFLPAASHSIPKRNRMRLYAFSFIPGWDARDTLTSATGYVYSCIPGWDERNTLISAAAYMCMHAFLGGNRGTL